MLVVYLIAAPLFLVASYFIKDQRTKTAFMILAGMSLVLFFVCNFGSYPTRCGTFTGTSFEWERKP